MDAATRHGARFIRDKAALSREGEACGAGILRGRGEPLETFDFKPELERMHGKTMEGKGENLGFFGQPGRLMKSVYPFHQ